jgi:hypothetical protein
MAANKLAVKFDTPTPLKILIPRTLTKLSKRERVVCGVAHFYPDGHHFDRSMKSGRGFAISVLLA